MTEKLKSIPSWVQLILALVGALVTGTLAFAAVRRDFELADKAIHGEINLLKKEDEVHKGDVEEIKQLLRDEFDRHHPRR